MRQVERRWAVTLTAAAVFIGVFAGGLTAQRATPAEVAMRFTGSWKMNMELSPQFRAPAGRQGSAAQAGPQLLAMRSASGTSALGFQRGGRGGGGGGAAANTDPAEIAGQQAIRGMQAVAETVDITATEASVTFKDPRGERTYAVDDKTTRITVDGAVLTTKSKWDRNTLKQEFIFGETKVSHNWEMNDAGNRIAFTMRIDNFGGGVGRQAKAVYDKQP